MSANLRISPDQGCVAKSLAQSKGMDPGERDMAHQIKPSPAAHDPDEAPDLSTPEWRQKFVKALLKSAPLDGVDLTRSSRTGRPVSLLEEPAEIETEEGYELALRAVEQYFEHEPEPGTLEAEAFNRLAEQIQAYEQKNWQIP